MHCSFEGQTFSIRNLLGERGIALKVVATVRVTLEGPRGEREGQGQINTWPHERSVPLNFNRAV